MSTTLPPPDLLPVFNAQPGATLLLSPEWVIVGASDDYLAATMTQREAIVGQHIFDAFPDNPLTPEANAVANVRASLTQVMATKQPHDMAPQHYDVPDRARPGHFVERHWLPRHTPVLDAAGQVQYIIQSVQDITASRVATRQLRESQASEQAARAEAEQHRLELRHFLEAAPVAVAVYHGPQHRVEMANATTLAIWGRTLDQVLHRPVFEALPEAATPDVVALFERVFTTGLAQTFYEQPTTLHRNGGTEQVYWNTVFEPQRGPDGRVTGIFTIGTDVTAQVRARQQVEQLNHALETRVQERTRELEAARAEAVEQRNRLQRLFSQAPAHINLFFGPDHVWTLVHPRTQELLGNRPVQGLPRRQALPELPEDQHEPLDRVFRTGQPVHQVEALRRLALRPDGELHDEYYDITYQPKFDAAGQVEGVMSFAVPVTERVRARQRAEALQAEVLAADQRQVQQRVALFHILADTPAAVALLRGPEHRFEYVNTAYQQLFPERQLTGLPVAEALPETEEAGFLAELDRVYRTGETFFGVELPMRVQPRDGRPSQPVYYTFTYQAYRENDQIAGISIFAFDVTGQVQARAQREAERLQLHHLFMEAPAPIVILDGPELVFQLVNPAYQRAFPGRALLGKPVLEALPELRGTALEEPLRAVYRTGEAFVAREMPLQMARHEGEPLQELYFSFTVQARRNPQGHIDGVLLFGHEVTDQVQARRVVEARETSFRLLADNVPGTLWVTNPAGECTYLSARWYATTGQTLAEGLGLGWTQAVHPDDAPGARADFLAANVRRGPYHSLYRLRQHDGQYRWVTDNGLPRFDATGAYEGMVGAVVDVHEQKLAELALQQLTTELRTSRDQAQDLAQDLSAANQQLTRTNVDLDNFIYTASHDLKAPISNIEGLLYLLQAELPAEVAQDAEVAPTLTRMLDAVERFKRTIDHLTEVSKLQKEHEPDTTLVNLAAVVEDVRQDLRQQLQAAGAKLFVDVSAQPPVQFSAKNLRSIVYNLLSNAVKYRHPNRTPHIDMRAHVRPGYTVLEVHDNGLGLAPEYLPRLFTMFQRFHDHVEGTGIGLYMVKRMVENAGGRIEVHSQLGAGTTFFVFLPHAARPAGQVLPAYLPS